LSQAVKHSARAAVAGTAAKTVVSRRFTIVVSRWWGGARHTSRGFLGIVASRAPQAAALISTMTLLISADALVRIPK
jgi:hypothetical protein